MTTPVTSTPQIGSTASGSSGGTAKVTVSEGTEYTILAFEDGTWRLLGTYTARTAISAIRDYLATAGKNSGLYVAVPTRSWQPVKVTAQTVTTLKLEEAK